jgi:hypothetical protein
MAVIKTNQNCINFINKLYDNKSEIKILGNLFPKRTYPKELIDLINNKPILKNFLITIKRKPYYVGSNYQSCF